MACQLSLAERAAHRKYQSSMCQLTNPEAEVNGRPQSVGRCNAQLLEQLTNRQSHWAAGVNDRHQNAASTEQPSTLIAQQARSNNLQVPCASPTHKAMHKTNEVGIKEGAADH